jgi:hypothetical protein
MADADESTSYPNAHRDQENEIQGENAAPAGVVRVGAKPQKVCLPQHLCGQNDSEDRVQNSKTRERSRVWLHVRELGEWPKESRA